MENEIKKLKKTAVFCLPPVLSALLIWLGWGFINWNLDFSVLTIEQRVGLVGGWCGLTMLGYLITVFVWYSNDDHL